MALEWICEVLSPSTSPLDRGPKLDIYGSAGVRWAWLVDSIAQLIEVFEHIDGAWVRRFVAQDETEAELPPFAAVPIDVSALWIP